MRPSVVGRPAHAVVVHHVVLELRQRGPLRALVLAHVGRGQGLGARQQAVVEAREDVALKARAHLQKRRYLDGSWWGIKQTTFYQYCICIRKTHKNPWNSTRDVCPSQRASFLNKLVIFFYYISYIFLMFFKIILNEHS